MRALKGLVIFMGILILLGMGLVAYAVLKRAGIPEEHTAANTAAVPVPAAPGKAYGPVEIPLPQGARIIRNTVSGQSMVVELELAGGGERVLVVDLANGAVTGTIDLRPQP